MFGTGHDTLESSVSRVEESFRTLRTSLFLSVMDRKLRSLLVTSSVASEGKTTTALNLASVIRQAGKRVLLIDGDLRRPCLSEKLSQGSPASGLSELVSETLARIPDQGSLTDFSVTDLIQLTRLQNRSGTLVVRNDSHEVAVDLVRGIPVSIQWTTRPEPRRLASRLVRQQRVAPDDARRALARQKGSGKKLGAVLLSMGLVEKDDLRRALLAHTLEALGTAAAMKAGTFRFTAAPWDQTLPAAPRGLDLGGLADRILSARNEPVFIGRAIHSAVRPTERENLFILPAGGETPNPSEILGSEYMGFVIRFLRKRFDLIIIDSPPVMAASDALALAPWVDGTLLVVRAGHTGKKVIQAAADRFQSAGLPLLGVLLNRVDIGREGYYSFYKSLSSSP
jgi:Mrp family chromosome partitioning ATPase